MRDHLPLFEGTWRVLEETLSLGAIGPKTSKLDETLQNLHRV